MFEVDEAARIITEAADPEANIIFGAVINDSYTGEIKITVVATGFDDVKRGVQIARPLGEYRPMSSAGAPSRTPVNSFGGQDSRPSTPSMPMGEEGASEYDIPAFIRQKMQK